MNVQAKIQRDTTPRLLKLNVEMFLLLKQTGAFAEYGVVELIDGAIGGVPLQNSEEPESDAVLPIKLRARDYVLLWREGLLDTLGRTELIDGAVYAMSPQHRPHWFIKNELAYRLRRAIETLGSDIYVGTEGSVLVSDHDVPEPDVIVTMEPVGDGPIPLASVRLLIEVADSSRTLDYVTKTPLYATAGIAEYWIADVKERLICQKWMPVDRAYTQSRDIAFGDLVSAETITGLTIATGGF